MSLVDQNGGLSAADVAAVMNGGGGGGWGGLGGGNGWWILLLFLFAMSGNWGNNLGGSGGHGVPFAMGIPAQAADVQRGFDQQATNAMLGGIQQQIGNGFADAAVARCAGDANIVTAITGAKDALATGMNSLAMSLQQCCCDNRAGLADLKYTAATEGCNTRQTVSDGIRDLMAQNTANTNAIVQSQQSGTQAIIDKLCQLELDSFKQKVADQAAEIAALKNAASQVAQTAALIQDNNAQTAALIQRIAPAPVPAYPVQNPNCCGGVNFGGCGA